MAPVVQLAVIVILSVMPARATVSALPDASSPGASSMTTAVQGLAAGLALTLSAVALGVLVFEAYGFGIFVVSPFIIGATTGYFANRTVDLGGSGTSKLVLGALLLGGLALLLVALESCRLPDPGLTPGDRHRGDRRLPGSRHCRPRAASAAACPERARPAAPRLRRGDHAAGRRHLREPRDDPHCRAARGGMAGALRTDLSQAPVSLPFRLGVAYPLHGETLGEGIGAMRLGTFSTGTVRERSRSGFPTASWRSSCSTSSRPCVSLVPTRTCTPPMSPGISASSRRSSSLRRWPTAAPPIERTSHELDWSRCFIGYRWRAGWCMRTMRGAGAYPAPGGGQRAAQRLI